MKSQTLEKRSSSGLAVLALSLALIGAASMVYYHLFLFMPRVQNVSQTKNLAGGYSFGIDFYPVWLTTRECVLQRCDPYSPVMTREIQKGIFGRALDTQISTDPVADYRTFAYPAFTDLLFWPASQFAFPAVRIALALLLGMLTIASIVFWLRALSWEISTPWLAVIFLLVLCSYQVLEGLYADQLGLLVGFLLAASILTLQRGRLLLAGLLMALTTIKPQMTALAILYLFVWCLSEWRARKLFVLGLFSTAAVLVGAAMMFWPHWIASWMHVVLGYHRYARPPLVSEVLAAPLGGAMVKPVSLLLTALLLVSAIWLIWRNRAANANSLAFWLTLSYLLAVTTVTLLPGQAIHDHVILLPAIFLLVRKNTDRSVGFSRTSSISTNWLAKNWFGKNWIGKTLLAAGIAIVLWPWMSAFSLIALRPLLAHDVFYSKAIFALPLRTAAAFPFVVLGLLTLALRGMEVAEASRG